MSFPTGAGGGSGPALIPDPNISGLSFTGLAITRAVVGQTLKCSLTAAYGLVYITVEEAVTGLVLDVNLGLIASLSTVVVSPPSPGTQDVALVSDIPLPAATAGKTIYVVAGPAGLIDPYVSGNVYQGDLTGVLWTSAGVPIAGTGGGGTTGTGGGGTGGAPGGGTPLPNPPVSGSKGLVTDLIAVGVGVGLLYVADRALFGGR